METKGLTGVFFYSPVNGKPDALDLADLATYARSLPEVGTTWDVSHLPLNDPDTIAQQIKKSEAQHIVIAGESGGGNEED